MAGAAAAGSTRSQAQRPRQPPLRAVCRWKITSPTGTVSPGSGSCLVTTPAAGAGISTVALSVITSTTGSCSATVAPSATSHWTISPSATPSPMSGRLELEQLATPRCRCCRRSRRWPQAQRPRPRALPRRSHRGPSGRSRYRPGRCPLRRPGTSTTCPHGGSRDLDRRLVSHHLDDRTGALLRHRPLGRATGRSHPRRRLRRYRAA